MRLDGVNSPGCSNQFVYEEMLSSSMIMVSIVLAIMVVGVFGIWGPMGTYDVLTVSQRLVFGALYAAVGLPVGYSTTVVTAYFLRRRSMLKIALGVIVVTLYVSVPHTAVVYTLGTMAHPHYLVAVGLPRLYVLVATLAVVYDTLFLYLVYLRLKHGGVVTAVRVAATTPSGTVDEQVDDDAETPAELAAGAPEGAPETGYAGSQDGSLASQSSQPAAGSEEKAEPQDGTPRESSLAVASKVRIQPGGVRGARTLQGGPPGLLPKLPTLGGDVIFLKSEDHYVYVCTSTDSALIKMRFADAVAELGDSGTQVHRSYWVAYHHMLGLTRRDRQLLLRLSGDYEVPISSRYRAMVQAVLQPHAGT